MRFLTTGSLESLKTCFLADGLVTPLLTMVGAEEAETRKHSIKIISQLVLNGALVVATHRTEGLTLAFF